jgi:hypothetical protein
MNKVQERRADIRLLCADLVELIWNDESGVEKRRVANLEDISSCGMSLQLEAPVHVGTRLRVRCGAVEMAGMVRYAIYRDEAYFMGVEFDENSRWSIRHFLPEHLLDPRKLVQGTLHLPAHPNASRWIN